MKKIQFNSSQHSTPTPSVYVCKAHDQGKTLEGPVTCQPSVCIQSNVRI